MESKEALNEIKNYDLVSYDENGEEDDCTTFGELEPNLIEAVEKDLNRLEKQDKAIEIVKKKNVDTTFLRGCLTLSEYNSSVATLNDLLQEEFDLLKEVLE